MLLLSLLVVGLLVFVVHLERRLKRLEELVAQQDAATTYEPVFEAEPQSVSPPEPVIEEPQSTVLYAEQRPEVLSEPEEWTEPEPAQERPQRFAFSIEDLFGRRLPIWAGGITLAVAGIFIVKLSIEAGLLSPPVRVIAGMIFGFALIGGAEAALRWQERVGDVRVRQALSGAGIASLYASILVAANLYHLVPALAAMLGIAAVTAAAMVLAIRFGAPSALLGLAGGLAAPALIGSAQPNVPLLSLYLAFTVAGLTTLSRSRKWVWLRIGALVGGFGWGVALLAGGALDLPATISLGLYILLLGVGVPALGLAGGQSDRLQLIAGILGAAQMAALVATGGFAMLHWGLFAAIAVATVWLASREPQLERLPPVGLAIALLLAGAWPDPEPGRLAIVLAGAALIYGFMPLRRLWSERGGLLDAAQLAVIAAGSWIVAMIHFHRLGGANDVPLGLLGGGLALGIGLVAALGWRFKDRGADARFAILAATAAFLLSAAAILLLPAWLGGIAVMAIGFGMLHLGQAAEDRRFEPLAWIFAAAGLIACFAPEALPNGAKSIDSLRSALIAAVAALFAWRARFAVGRAVAQFAAASALYWAAAVWLDDRLDPSLAGLILVAAAWLGRVVREERFLPAMAAAVLIVAAWAIEPMYLWVEGSTLSLFGMHLLVGSVPQTEPALARLLVPGLFAGAAVWLAHARLHRWERIAGVAIAAALAVTGLHSLYKQIFAISGEVAFIARGFAERTLWEAVLVAAAAAANRLGWRRIGLGLAGAAAFHFAWYSLLLHNPLAAEQAVGSLPVFNLLLPAYALPITLLVVLGKSDLADRGVPRRAISIALMALITLFAFSELRQLFHGGMLVEPGVGPIEDIARSILAIAFAVGFLLWGIVKQDRDWRIASLALMLAAVGKVFLFDAAGLEGVTRIASFVALGFSLIGIGWLYSRYLPDEAQVAKLASSR